MVALLFRLTGLYLEKRRWIHRNRFMALAQCGDFARFRHYGFVRQKTNDDEDKKDSGLWKPTQDGMSFLLGETAIHTHMLCRPPSLYIIDTSTPKRFVRDFVGKKFSYAELINEVPQHYRKDAK